MTNLRRFVVESESEDGGREQQAVGQGVEFWDGRCVMLGTQGVRCLAVYTSSADLLAIHGHKATLRYLDD